MYQAGQLKQYAERCFYVIGNGPGGVAGTSNWIPWTVPKEARFVSFMVVGAGAGGAAGTGGVAAATRAGGSGGGSGGITSAIYPARALPTTMHICMTPGGAGGVTSAQSGGGGGNVAGTTTLILSVISSISGSTNSAHLIIYANGGTGGTSTTAGAAGAAGAINNMGYGQRALSLLFNAGQVGIIQNVSASNLSAIMPVTGGGGGAGTTLAAVFNAGNINQGDSIMTGGATGTVALVRGGLSASTVNGSNGLDTLLNCKPFGNSQSPWYSLGGAGGASSDAGQGGNGGIGGIGSGGGGGGAGVTGSHGVGGRGGAGFCIIEWW